MKKITRIIAFIMAFCFLLSSCVMGGGEDDKKDPKDITDNPRKEEPKPPDPEPPPIDVNVNDTVPIN